MRRDYQVSYYILFLIWPFLAVLYGIRKFGKPFSNWLIILGISIIGYTTQSVGDLESYELDYYKLQGVEIGTVINSYLDLASVDIYSDLLSVSIGLLGFSHHIYFAFLFGIFGYFLIGVIDWFYQRRTVKLEGWLLILFISFALYYSIRYTISIRFYTGGIFYLFILLRYISTPKLNYLILSFLAPIFHFALGALIIVIPLLILFRNNVLLAFSLAISTFFITQPVVVSTLGRQVELYKGTALEKRYDIYAADVGRERLEAHYETAKEMSNWKLQSLNFLREALIIIILIAIVFIFIYRERILLNNNYLIKLFVAILLLLSISNIMVNVSNGVRFLVFYNFIFLGFLTLIFRNLGFNVYLKKFTIFLGIVTLIFGLISIYASNALFTYKLFIGNLFILIL